MGKVIYPRKGEVHTTPVTFSSVLNDNTWEQIREASDQGLASSLWSVGDIKVVHLNGTVGKLTIDSSSIGGISCYIIGFDHNASVEGDNRIHFQFGYDAFGVNVAFTDSGYGSQKTSGDWFNMKNTSSNSGGWKSSRMRTTICPAFKSTMPSDLQAVLKATTKYSDNTGGKSDTASYVTATTDEIFLLAEFEVVGSRTYANSAEQNYQAQYAWYSAGNSKVKHKHSDTDTTARWWLRSVRVSSSIQYCYINTDGTAGPLTSTYSQGFAPAFCV